MRQSHIFALFIALCISFSGVYATEANNTNSELNSTERTSEANNSTEANSNITQSDAILTEISIIEKQIELYTQKLDSLKKLHAYCISKNITIPSIAGNFFDVWNKHREGFISSKGASSYPQGSSNTAQSQQEVNAQAYQNSYEVQKAETEIQNRIVKKSSISVNGTVTDLQYMPIRSILRGGPEDLASSHLIVSVIDSKVLRVLDVNGHLLLEIDTDAHISKTTLSTHTDEFYIICWTNDQRMLSYLIDMQRVAIAEESGDAKKKSKEKKFEIRYNYTLEYDISFRNEDFFQEFASQASTNGTLSPTEPEFYTAFQSVISKNQKIQVLGTCQGNILVFWRNGTFLGKSKVGEDDIVSLYRMYPNVLYATKSVVGFLNPLHGSIVSPVCDDVGGEIVDVIPDAHLNSYFYVMLKNGELIVYEHKHATNNCKAIAKRNSALGTTGREYPHGRIYSMRSFVLMRLDPQQPTLLAYNITDPLAFDYESLNALNIPLPASVETANSPVSYQVARNGPISALITVYTTDQDPSQISVFELAVPRPPVSDWFASARLPIIVVGIILVIGYQIWSNRKKTADKRQQAYERITQATGGGGFRPRQKGGASRGNIENLEEQTRMLEQQLKNMGADLKLDQMIGTKAFENRDPLEDEGDDNNDNDDEDDEGYKNISSKKRQ